MTEPILKFDEAKQLVFGWANVSITKEGVQIIDTQKDMIDPEELELAAYAFTLQYRETGEMHVGEAKGHLVESFAVTKEKLAKMGLPEDSLPQGWWVGFYIEDPEVYEKVRSGVYKMFSVQGKAVREVV
jgi:hypothetical protein